MKKDKGGGATIFSGLCAVLIITGQASALTTPTTVFTDNFDSGVASPQFSGVPSVVGVQGYSGIGGFLGNFLRSGGTETLTLNGLPAHTSVTVNFMFAAIDSWDGFVNAGPDFFNVTVDGASVFSETFDNSIGLGDQGFDPANATGARLSYGSNLGFTVGGPYNDAAYDMSVLPAFSEIPHSASSLTVSWFANGAGWQGNADRNDESWAIDAVEIIVDAIDTKPPPPKDNPIPEPVTAGLTFMSLGALTVATRRRRK